MLSQENSENREQDEEKSRNREEALEIGLDERELLVDSSPRADDAEGNVIRRLD